MKRKASLNAEEMLEKIFYYMNRLIDEKDFSTVILLLTDLGRTLVHSERASFWYWDTHKRQYWTIAASESDRIIVSEGSGIIDASIQNRETILINNPYEDERFNQEVDRKTGYITKSILCMPVTNDKGRVIGAYQAINKLSTDDTEEEFDEHDVKRLALAAVYCGKTLESYLLYREVRVDPLTELKNRRGFLEYYEECVRPCSASETVSVVMCDIDFFKKVNDSYGHNAGDAVLVHIAQLLQSSLGERDEAVRWGGEEFVLLLWGKTSGQAAEAAEQLRKSVEQSCCEYEGEKIRVTMSFGVIQLDRGRTINENIEDADEKLYQAKATGRNKVTV